MKTELARLQLYKEQLLSLRSSLTDVPSNVYSPDWKPLPLRMEKLDQYLSVNDCSQTAAKATCYNTTRLLLIATTKELDKTSAKVDSLNQVIDRLTETINTMINELANNEKKKK